MSESLYITMSPLPIAAFPIAALPVALDFFRWALCAGIVILWLTLLAMMLTRWGQVRPIAKCAVLSLFAHLLLGGYAYVTNLFVDVPSPGSPKGGKQFAKLRIVDDLSGELDRSETTSNEDLLGESLSSKPSQPWEQFTNASPTLPAPEGPSRLSAAASEWTPASRRVTATDGPSRISAVGFESSEKMFPVDSSTAPSISSAKDASAAPATEIETPSAVWQKDPSLVEMPSPSAGPARRAVADAPLDRNKTARTKDVSQQMFAPSFAEGSPKAIEAIAVSTPLESVAPFLAAALARPLPRRLGDGQELPSELRFRVADEKPQAAQQMGGNEQTEKAVRAALDWLAPAQRPTGEWDAASFGAGRETKALGQDRSGVGADANAGVTGLALLAYLGAGHTHLEGDFRETVTRGLEYLLRAQAADGNLAGTAQLYAHMYCHGMATLALSEALAMTGDARLRPAVEQAVGYTIAAQHSGGGWRYLPQDRGDMSQFGWQVMALRSAQMAGVEIPEKTRRAMLVFLDSVSSGRHRGLASYRQNEKQSRTMTAEALLCRLLLPTNPSPETIDEAVKFIVEELPGQGEPNEYYWYYGTLALHQLQGDTWRTWNEALQKALLARQQTEGQFAGSWNPDTVWSGYGGRVYSTAMSALCLEAYYRYLPKEQEEAAVADKLETPTTSKR